IKELCQQFPQGITDQVIQNDMPQLEPQQRAVAINKLLSLCAPGGGASAAIVLGVSGAVETGTVPSGADPRRLSRSSGQGTPENHYPHMEKTWNIGEPS
ncbi:hypothetical protein AMECASPLE_038320, partial [Ameca splendens]